MVVCTKRNGVLASAAIACLCALCVNVPYAQADELMAGEGVFDAAGMLVLEGETEALQVAALEPGQGVFGGDAPASQLDKTRAAIAALPADPKSVQRMTANKGVVDAESAYLALSASQRAQLSDDEKLLLAECAISVLPSDPYKVTEDHKTPILNAESIVESLPASLQKKLDEIEFHSSSTYGRYLENAVWALDGLNEVSNTSTLGAGTYTNQFTSSSHTGKSNSQRSKFKVASVTVSDGKATAILEHGSNSSGTIRMGGIEYLNLQEDPSEHSYYEVPICLNSTFHFSVKGKDATEDTDAITYEMTVTADEASMVPDSETADGADGGTSSASGSGSQSSAASGSGSATSSGSGGGTNLNTLVTNRGNAAAAAKPAPAASQSADSAANTPRPANAGSAGSARLSEPAGKMSSGRADDVRANAAPAVAPVDLTPAVGGFAMLMASAGLLAFTLRFLRRESRLAR